MNPRWLHALTAALAVSLFGFAAFAWSRRVDAPAAVLYQERLQSLLAVDFRLIAEVLKSRSGIVGHYDGIVQAEAARKRIHRELREMPAFLPVEATSELLRELDSAEQIRRDEDDLVERFKREHAVLRNSLRYLPVLVRDLDQYVADHPEALVLREHAAAVVRDELLLQSWDDRTLVQRIDRNLDDLSHAIDAVAEPERSQLRMVVAHARVVREKSPIVRDQVRQIVALESPERTRAITSVYSRHYQAALDRTGSDWRIVFVLAIVALAAAAASIIVRLRQSAQTLRKTSTQLAEANDSLRKEKEKQEELTELKSRFVSMASHEFRTPLSVIMSSSEMLEAYQEKWSAEKQQDHFTRIRSAALGMTRMLDAILLIGRRDAGLLKFEPKPLEVTTFCEEVVAAVGDATGHGARVKYARPSAPEHVVADETLLRHVLENLLSNALKYSPEGGEVELDVERSNGEIVFRVSDRGIGISKKDRDRLFENFHRGENVGSIKGTGLGLAIVRGATELHGGTVEVDSELGVGTEFTVRIPVEGSHG